MSLPVKQATDVLLGEDGAQAKRGLGIRLSLGDEEAEAAAREVRQSPRVGTEHGEKRAVAFGKKKSKSQVRFFLDVCGLNCWPLKFSSSQDCWLTDRLSRTLKESLCRTQVSRVQAKPADPACLSPRLLPMPGFFRGLQAMQLDWEALC